jgi:hypothetical protein
MRGRLVDSNGTKVIMQKRYQLPSFLTGQVKQETYKRWIRRKAQTHVRRDRRRGNQTAIGEEYRVAIHSAVLESGGRDSYTGEELAWSLISKYDNDEAKEYRRDYKRRFALLPTVDHVGDGIGAADFKICSWRTNDAKNDLELSAFLDLCQAVLEHQGYVVKKRS